MKIRILNPDELHLAERLAYDVFVEEVAKDFIQAAVAAIRLGEIQRIASSGSPIAYAFKPRLK